MSEKQNDARKTADNYQENYFPKILLLRSHELDEIEVTLNKINLRLSIILNYANENEIEPTVEFVLKELATEREYEHAN